MRGEEFLLVPGQQFRVCAVNTNPRLSGGLLILSIPFYPDCISIGNLEWSQDSTKFQLTNLTVGSGTSSPLYMFQVRMMRICHCQMLDSKKENITPSTWRVELCREGARRVG